MSKLTQSKIGSTVYARLNEVSMPEAGRRKALMALHDAELLVDGFVWVGKKMEQLKERLFLKPSLKH